MKRSEMLEIMDKYFMDHGGIENLSTDSILTLIENLGMLPPSLVDKTNYRYGHIAWCKWSDE